MKPKKNQLSHPILASINPLRSKKAQTLNQPITPEKEEASGKNTTLHKHYNFRKRRRQQRKAENQTMEKKDVLSLMFDSHHSNTVYSQKSHFF